MTAAVSELSKDLEEKILLEDKFKALAREWKNATILDSRVKDIVFHIAYQRIIALGPAVVPLILKDLVEHGPDHWFWALRVITNDNPITADMSGDMVAMTEAWLQWGMRTGYLKDYPTSTSATSLS